MRVPSLTVDMLAAVIALAQKKNLEPAGKELGLSPSAVHKRINVANQVFGTRLFVGTNDGFELTEVGQVLYSHATLFLTWLRPGSASKSRDDSKAYRRSFVSIRCSNETRA